MTRGWGICFDDEPQHNGGNQKCKDCKWNMYFEDVDSWWCTTIGQTVDQDHPNCARWRKKDAN